MPTGGQIVVLDIAVLGMNSVEFSALRLINEIDRLAVWTLNPGRLLVFVVKIFRVRLGDAGHLGRGVALYPIDGIVLEKMIASPRRTKADPVAVGVVVILNDAMVRQYLADNTSCGVVSKMLAPA